MIGRMPLWMVLAIWFLQRQTALALTYFNLPRQLRLLADIQMGLPVPMSRLEVWLIREILEWVEREQSSIYQLQAAGVVAVGIMPRDIP